VCARSFLERKAEMGVLPRPETGNIEERRGFLWLNDARRYSAARLDYAAVSSGLLGQPRSSVGFFSQVSKAVAA
jgi:hypothetical protein